MSAKRRRRTAKKGRHPAQRTTRGRQHTSVEPDLLADVRRALNDRHPLSLLTYVSTLLCVTDTRRNHPFAQPDTPDLAALTREELSIRSCSSPSTSAEEAAAFAASAEAQVTGRLAVCAGSCGNHLTVVNI
jgi:hypothetical protein